jgi:hypothetical protein
MIRRFSNFAVFFLAAIALCPSIGAQSIGLAPSQIVDKFKPGVPFQFELAAENNDQYPVELSVQITDLWYNEKNEKVFSTPGTSPRSAANWIQFVPEHFQVPAHGTQKMKAIVTPPADASGGYYAVLFVQSKPQLSPNHNPSGKTLMTNVRVGCLVLLSAENTEDYKVQLSNIKLSPPTANQGLDVDFDFANGSNTHVFPLPRIAVLDSNRKLVAKAEGDMKRFLPGQKNSLHVGWTGSLAPGDYTAVLTVAYGEDRIETQQVPFSVKP